MILTLLSAESILAVRHQQSTSQHYTAEKSFFMEVGIITDAGLSWAGLGWAELGWAGLGWAVLGWHQVQYLKGW